MIDAKEVGNLLVNFQQNLCISWCMGPKTRVTDEVITDDSVLLALSLEVVLAMKVTKTGD